MSKRVLDECVPGTVSGESAESIGTRFPLISTGESLTQKTVVSGQSYLCLRRRWLVRHSKGSGSLSQSYS